MVWIVKNVVGGLLLLPCNLLLAQCAGIAIWRRRPRLGRLIVSGTTAGLILCAMPGVSGVVMGLIERSTSAIRLEDPGLTTRADAIVVLGGGRILGAQEYSGQDTASSSSFLRLRYAMEIQRKTGKPILISGGKPGSLVGPSEARLMDNALRDSLGGQAKWIEERSENTAENAQFSFNILHAQGIDRIFLVTHAWHMPRAMRAFRRVGFAVVSAPMDFSSDKGGGGTFSNWIPSSGGLDMSYLAMHEGMGMIWYRLMGED